MKNAATAAVRFEEIAGTKIAVFEEQLEDDKWTTFVGFPRSNIVLVATDVDYLRAVLSLMSGASGPRPLAETLPEWRYVDTLAPIWGLRHYQRLEAGLDPTSPFSGGDAADNSAVGVGFWFERSAGRVVVTYLSPGKNVSFRQGCVNKV